MQYFKHENTLPHTWPNYPHKAQAPYNKINKNSVITEFKNNPIIGWVLVALDAEVRSVQRDNAIINYNYLRC